MRDDRDKRENIRTENDAPFERLKVSQAIVVEGRDDVDVVTRACDAMVIATHGFGIAKETWELLEKAYREKGLVILTDPDFSGEEIRKRLTARFPDSIQAYLPLKEAVRKSDGDIGIENARPQDVAEAIKKAHGVKVPDGGKEFFSITLETLGELGLAGGPGASAKRAEVGARLGIGYGNTKTFLRKLRQFGISEAELREAAGAEETER